MRPYLEKSQHERVGGVAQGVGPEFQPQYCKNKTKTNKKQNLNAEFESMICFSKSVAPSDVSTTFFKWINLI
jgi:hypothetical protein